MPFRPSASPPRRDAKPWLLAAALLLCAWQPAAQPAPSQAAAAARPTGDDALVVEAREALRREDRVRLDALKAATRLAAHPLAQWVDYFELTNRLADARQDELDAFYARWPGTYVEDRLRNDWLLELGKRRDWANFAREFPRFRMNDDAEVTCYALVVRHQAGEDVAAAARAHWFAQRELGEGCALMARTLHEARRLLDEDAWQEVRLSAEFNRPGAARAAAALVDREAAATVAQVFADPARVLARLPSGDTELATVALIRLAAADPGAAAAALDRHWQRRLEPAQAALAWAITGKQAALRLAPEASAHYARAWQQFDRPGPAAPAWSDDTLAWQVRAALRAAPSEAERWRLVLRAVDAMSEGTRADATWVYWRARALHHLAPAGAEGDAQRAEARQLLQSIAGQMSFYGKLALEDLGGRVQLPPPPATLTDAERTAARQQPGLARALHLIAIGLRSEGVREWNFTLRGMGDRELLAAAQLACEREVWDRCINTSDRTRGEVDIAQRFPTPFRAEVVAQARRIGLDPAYMYGLIRQESRFILDARSSVGASGLMQVMPATARWTARRIGLEGFRPEMINDRDINLQIGAGYLRLVLDDFEGSQALAAAAYNAGPSRPRRWREGATLEPAAWAEAIPFTETRDYVKKVLSNAVYYAAVLGSEPVSLKTRLGGPIGPRDASAPAPSRDLP